MKPDPLRNPYASLRWHYPDQVQRVFLTHATRTSNLRATQDPRVSSAHNTLRERCLATVSIIRTPVAGVLFHEDRGAAGHDAAQQWRL